MTAVPPPPEALTQSTHWGSLHESGIPSVTPMSPPKGRGMAERAGCEVSHRKPAAPGRSGAFHGETPEDPVLNIRSPVICLLMSFCVPTRAWAFILIS